MTNKSTRKTPEKYYRHLAGLCVSYHSFRVYAKFYEKLTFLPLTRTNTHTYIYISFSENFAYVLNELFLSFCCNLKTWLANSFHAIGLFMYPLKTAENSSNGLNCLRWMFGMAIGIKCFFLFFQGLQQWKNIREYFSKI